jgi:hypothetical protein
MLCDSSLVPLSTCLHILVERFLVLASECSFRKHAGCNLNACVDFFLFLLSNKKALSFYAFLSMRNVLCILFYACCPMRSFYACCPMRTFLCVLCYAYCSMHTVLCVLFYAYFSVRKNLSALILCPVLMPKNGSLRTCRTFLPAGNSYITGTYVLIAS